MEELAAIVAKRFIQRRDVKAVQFSADGYMPVTDGKDGPRLPFKMRDIIAHLEGSATYGHYLLDSDSNCRLFAFDIDLRPPGTEQRPFTGTWVQFPTADRESSNIHEVNDLRTLWHDRKQAEARSWLKYQFRYIGNKLAATASRELDLPVAMAYSGNKGIHVYCFTGPVPASEAREGAQIVLEACGCFEPDRGKAFYKHSDPSPRDGFPNLSVEVFPKQDSLDGKDLGNLMRLPFGVNRKHPKDPTFLIDSRAPYTELVAHKNPLELLRTGNAWI